MSGEARALYEVGAELAKRYAMVCRHLGMPDDSSADELIEAIGPRADAKARAIAAAQEFLDAPPDIRHYVLVLRPDLRRRLREFFG